MLIMDIILFGLLKFDFCLFVLSLAIGADERKNHAQKKRRGQSYGEKAIREHVLLELVVL